MRTSIHPATRILLAFAVLFAVLLGAQAMAARSAPPGGVSSTGRTIGQTGFAYIGGLRTFAAAVLWNRLDPIFDTYYGSFDESFQAFLPHVRLVQALDPQFQMSYYVTSFWLQKTGRPKEAIALAELGLKNNPEAGLMHAGVAQLLFIEAKGQVSPRMLELAREGVSSSATWANPDDQFEGYGTFASIFDNAGDKTAVSAIRNAQAAIKAGEAVSGVRIEAPPAPQPRKN